MPHVYLIGFFLYSIQISITKNRLFVSVVSFIKLSYKIFLVKHLLAFSIIFYFIFYKKSIIFLTFILEDKEHFHLQII